MNRRRREFTQADKIAIRGRATDGAGRVFCEKCGIWIKSRKGYEFHHLIPEGMRRERKQPLVGVGKSEIARRFGQ